MFTYNDDYDDYIPPENEDEIDDFINSIDKIINSRGGIDKCMCCGKYKYNDQLTYPGQVCKSGCVNPNEY